MCWLNSEQKLRVFKFFLTFSALAMFATSMFGFAMYRLTINEMQQQLIINTMFVNLFMQIFTGVATLVLAITDASKEELQQQVKVK